MSAMREELTVEDLAFITAAIRSIVPEMKEVICIGVEVPKLYDRNVIFHMKNSDQEDPFVMMISADLLLGLFGPK